MLSEKFLNALRDTGKPIHKIAWAAGVTPGMVYKLTAGIDRPKLGDKRVKKLCAYLGLSEDEAYADEHQSNEAGVA